MIILADAVASPSTVIIKALDTPHAYVAVLGSQLLPCVTVHTPSACKIRLGQCQKRVTNR